MDDRDQTTSADHGSHPVSRRVAVHQAGIGLAAVAAVVAGGRVALAEPAATPAAGATPTAGMAGLFASVRHYQLVPGKSMDELVRRVQAGFVPIVRSVPGFVEYLLIVDASTGAQVSVSVFQDSASADESTRKAAAWVAANIADFNEGPPEVTTGTVGVHAAADPSGS